MENQWKKSLFCYSVEIENGILLYHTGNGLLVHATRVPSGCE